MAKMGIYLTPTLSCYGMFPPLPTLFPARRNGFIDVRSALSPAGIMQRAPWEDFLPPSGQVKNKQVMERGLEALKLAEEEGVTVC